MPIGDDDLGVFYDADALGTQCARVRPGEADAPFVAITGANDVLALDGYAVSTEYGIKYPTADVDLDTDDGVLVGCARGADGAAVLIAGAAQGGTLYRVRAEPRRVNDGRESYALLSSIAE